jgi:hypothetical protein
MAFVSEDVFWNAQRCHEHRSCSNHHCLVNV